MSTCLFLFCGIAHWTDGFMSAKPGSIPLIYVPIPLKAQDGLELTAHLTWAFNL